MPSKTGHLSVRLLPEDMERLKAVAESQYLEPSAWARQTILRALDVAQRGAKLKRGPRSHRAGQD